MIQETFRHAFLSTLPLPFKQTCTGRGFSCTHWYYGRPSTASSFHQVLPCLWWVSSSVVAPRHLQLEEQVCHTMWQCSAHFWLWGSLSTAMACPQPSLVKIIRKLAGLISPAASRTEISNCPSASFPAEKEFGVKWHLVTWPCDAVRVHSEAWSSLKTPGLHEQVSWTELVGHRSFYLSPHAFGSRPSGVHFSKAWPVTCPGHSTLPHPHPSWCGLHWEQAAAIQVSRTAVPYPPFPSSGLWGQSPCLPLSVTGDTSFRWKPYPVRRCRD